MEQTASHDGAWKAHGGQHCPWMHPVNHDETTNTETVPGPVLCAQARAKECEGGNAGRLFCAMHPHLLSCRRGAAMHERQGPTHSAKPYSQLQQPRWRCTWLCS